MTTYFTSDLHFGHKRIVELSRRPFPDVPTMETEIIRRWNDRVTAADQVFLLGDFSFGNKTFQTNMLKQLHGRILLVRGNHDAGYVRMRNLGFADVMDNFEMSDEAGVRWYLAHKPWWESRHGAIGPRHQLCGHVHNDWVRLRSADNDREEYDIINVGVDVWDFTPRTFQELIMATPRILPLEAAMAIPHHGEM